MITEMDYRVFMEYLLCVEPLSAGETMNSLQVSTFPNLKKEKQRQVEKDLKRAMKKNISLEESTKPKDTSEIYHQLLRTLGNG